MAQQILDVVAGHGATTVFGLPGVHNLAFWRGGRADADGGATRADRRVRRRRVGAGDRDARGRRRHDRSGRRERGGGLRRGRRGRLTGAAGGLGDPAGAAPPGPAARRPARVPRPGGDLRAAGRGGVHPPHGGRGRGGAGRRGGGGDAPPPRPGVPRRPRRRPGCRSRAGDALAHLARASSGRDRSRCRGRPARRRRRGGVGGRWRGGRRARAGDARHPPGRPRRRELPGPRLPAHRPPGGGRCATARTGGGRARRVGRRAPRRRWRPRRHEHPQLDDAAPAAARHARRRDATRRAGVGPRRRGHRAAR